MAFTRQHFEVIAEVICNGREHFSSASRHAAFAADTAVRLSLENPRFDIARFLTACQPYAVVGSSKERTYDRAALDAQMRVARIRARAESNGAAQ